MNHQESYRVWFIMQPKIAGLLCPFSFFLCLHFHSGLFVEYFSPMTFEEKRRLGQNIGKMPPENVNHIIQIVKEMNGAGEGGSEDDLEFDVDAQVHTHSSSLLIKSS